MVALTKTDIDAPLWRDSKAIALLMAASLTVMANATISPALPGLEERFADHPDAAFLTRILVPAPSLTVVFFAPLAGLAADRFGKRWMLLTGVLLFVVSGTAGLYLPSLDMILASRLVLGVAVAMIMTAQTALVGDYFTGDKRSTMMGWQTSARNFGGFVFIVSAGWLAVTSPRLPFAIYALAALIFPLIWIAVTEPRLRRHDGQAAKETEVDGHPAWILLLGALAFLQMVTNMTFFIMPTQLPFFLDDQGYDSAAMTGAGLGALTLAGGCAALLYSRIKRTIGHAGAYALGYGMMALGFALLSLGAGSPAIFVGAIAIGIGFAIVMPNFVAIALALAPASRRGLAGGTLTTSVFLGQFLSPFLSIPAISAFGYDGAFQTAALSLATLATVAAVQSQLRRVTHR